MTDTLLICSFEWRASRVDVPNSVLVTHVCEKNQDHLDDTHFCCCGAELEVAGD